MRIAPLVGISLVVALTCSLSSTASAAWPHTPDANLRLCTAAGTQLNPTIVSDGAGGAIIGWQDSRRGNYDIYAQHVLASGVLDPVWPANGTALCAGYLDELNPRIASDGTGGAIAVWRENDGNTINAQHVLASGVVDPAWAARSYYDEGISLWGPGLNPAIVSDGAGGAIVTWQDLPSGTNYDIVAQHVLATGALDPAWSPPYSSYPVTLCSATKDQLNPTIVSDDAGGAIVTWQDFRGGSNYDIYAQHVLASGAVDPAWTINGTALCTAANNQTVPMIISDGAGGAIVTWNDYRSGSSDIYAQHVLASGVVDPAWPANGAALCTAASTQYGPAIITDGADGAFVTWYDNRSGNLDIYAQHLLASGVVDPAWPANGTALCTAARGQYNPVIAPDGAGGLIVAWYDLRNGTSYDIYAQHVLSSGVVDPSWPLNGAALCTAAGDQTLPVVVVDDAGGAIVTWADARSDTSAIFAQRVALFGYLGTPEAEVTGVTDVPNDQGGKVNLAWTASYLDLESDPHLAAYDIYRSAPLNPAAQPAARGVRAVRGLDRMRARGGAPVVPGAAHGYSWEYLATVDPSHSSAGYSCVVPTSEDSTGEGNRLAAFMVLARNSSGSMYWPSRPDSGYSADNLPPTAPAPFTGAYLAGATHLHWGANTEPDLAGYRLYRGSSPGFVPGPASLVSAQPDTGYDDPGAAGRYYKLSAVDVHDNQSPFALLGPTGTLDVVGPLPASISLESPAPSPAAGSTTLRYMLPREMRVELAVYDATGRRVRALISRVEPAGEHALSWDLRDDTGHAVGAGLYFVRFEADGRRLSRRMVALR